MGEAQDEASSKTKKPVAKTQHKKDEPQLSDEIYQFKVTLVRLRPQIWRRIQVPGDATFEQFDRMIIEAMGWKDDGSKRHQFSFSGDGGNYRIVNHYEDYAEQDDCHDEKKELIADHFAEPNADKSLFEHDFDDRWEHCVAFESILPRNKKFTYPRCTAGKRACPPEGCGGAHMYKRILGKLQSGDHDWLEQNNYNNFDPEDFDHKAVQFSHKEAGKKGASKKG